MRTNFDELLEAGVHFGHLKSKWNPSMAPYIFQEKNGIHVIDLNKTVKKIETAASAMKQITKSGKKILFVATKKQAKHVVAEIVKETNMPYITERWLGGMLTNFSTVKKSIRKMQAYDKMLADGTIETMSKRERLQRSRQREKLETVFGSISDMNRTPAAIFIVDIKKENIALAEAKKLGIPVFGMVDTNSNPKGIDFVIPSNDDASKSIAKIIGIMADAIKEGLAERTAAKGKEVAAKA
ncbi:MAG: small subunit ribosomal protein S2 [Urechidicola sp.]|jgi:small subunit ribosomal protein S2|tara:strand:+ start:4213 stop:4932 length:720 start_codon:yes stop_codon:yes gene_type:complete